jgi:c-di-GMP phosphodiesterase
MTEYPLLSQIALAYSPVINRNRTVIATRLTVYPVQPGVLLNAARLLDALAQVWPVDGSGPVWLNIADEQLLSQLINAQPATHISIEIPAFMACDPAHQEAIHSLHSNGNTLLLKDRPNIALPRELLQCFTHAVVDIEDERRLPGGSPLKAAVADSLYRGIGFVQTGVSTVADMEFSFQRGATAVLGWPIDDVTQGGATRNTDQPSLQAVVQLIDQVHKEAAIEVLENTLKRDPALAYKLLRFINSPAFGLSVEISSFKHAIMVLGYRRLKRWLALLLVTASKDPNMRPVMFAAVRRGLLMEQLGTGRVSEEQADELFICGIFSLLDRMFNQPFEQLFRSIPVTERVYQALSEGQGPYQPYFQMVQAVEGLGLMDIRDARDALMLSMQDVNIALLDTLKTASSLDH